MMRGRQKQHESILSSFSVPLKKFPDVPRISKARVEGVLRSLNHSDEADTLEMFEEYVSSNHSLLHWLSENAHFRHGSDSKLAQKAKELKKSAWGMKKRILNNNLHIRSNMADALRWSAVLDAEAKQAQSIGNRGLLPYLGTGALASGLGYAVGGPIGGALAGGAGLAARYGYDMMANPARSLANMQKFFAATDAFDDFIGSQVERYFKWVNTATPDKTGRLVYSGPGSESSGRFPSVLSSRFIAQYVSGEED